MSELTLPRDPFTTTDSIERNDHVTHGFENHRPPTVTLWAKGGDITGYATGNGTYTIRANGDTFRITRDDAIYLRNALTAFIEAAPEE